MKQTEQPKAVILPYEHDREFYIDPIGDIENKWGYRMIKRLMDIVGSVCALCVFAIPMLILALVIKLDSKGPVFYCQERLGLNGKPFQCIKFRSMRLDAEIDGAQWSNGDDDPRITKVGKFIRSTSIDELPQFWNVLKGDMSLVGTRPPTVDEFKQYEARHKRRLSMKPGLTGLWQVSGRSNIEDFEEVVRLDCEYIDNWSIQLDIQIILKTVVVIFKKVGSK